RFYGFGTVPNGTSRRAFLTDGQEVYVVAEGETFLNRFRILRIGNASLEFEEIATGRAGSTPMIEEPAGGPPRRSPAAGHLREQESATSRDMRCYWLFSWPLRC